LEEPGEDWSCNHRENTCIGTGTVPLASLVDGTDELNDCLNCIITDSEVCGLFQSDSRSATSTEGSVNEVQWSVDVHCVLRKMKTVNDIHKT